MSARTRSVSAVIPSASAPPVLWIDVGGQYPHLALLLRSSASWARSSAGPVLLDPRVAREAASSSRGAPHSESLGFERARFAADRPRRTALRVRTPGLACVAGWSPPGGRARSESVLAACAMLARLVSTELIDLPFSHLSHVASNHPVRLQVDAGGTAAGCATCQRCRPRRSPPAIGGSIPAAADPGPARVPAVCMARAGSRRAISGITGRANPGPG